MNPVLDASALLAYLHRERGWEAVRSIVAESCVGAVNWSEVAQKTTGNGLDVGRARSLLEDVGLVIVPFTAKQAEMAAALWEQTNAHGLSLADRACLALALEFDAPAFTADKAWGALNVNVDIRIVR